MYSSLLTGWVKRIYEDIDFPGSDIRNFLVDNVEACQKDCQFYSYVTDTDIVGRYSIPYINVCKHAH